MPRTSPPLSEAEAPGSTIGSYRLLDRIGEGGCGVVFLAEQLRPFRRFAAVKILKPGPDSDGVIQRFEAERQALALLTHPNIAGIYDAGQTISGRPYFVMELVEGDAITAFADAHTLPLPIRLDLFLQVCRAMEYMHHAGIIHRDLKPSNILVSEQGGEPIVKIIDFGIAKATGGQRLTDHSVHTVAHQFLGTPAYVSPEQAGSNSASVDHRSDVYSLGALLYELLTGVPPFDPISLRQAPLERGRLMVLSYYSAATTSNYRDCPERKGVRKGSVNGIVILRRKQPR